MQSLKTYLKHRLASILGNQVRELTARNPELIVIGVAGSYGKTGTKLAIATVLSQTKRVRYQSGNYNDILSVPLIFFGEELPNLMNPFAWLGIWLRNRRQIRRPYPYDIVVVEIGTDAPGQIAEFGTYLSLNIAVLTSIAREHMANFTDVDAVAREELAVADYAATVIVNSDLCPRQYLTGREYRTYGFSKEIDYHIQTKAITPASYTFEIYRRNTHLLTATSNSPSKAQVYSAAAAVAAGDTLGLPTETLAQGVAGITPSGGRMQLLEGIRHSTIWDETYNASPEAVKGALDTFYALPGTHKVALLGNMNELGGYSAAAHTEVGNYCQPAQLDMVVTLGPDANTYLAAAARRQGCRVHTCTSPYEAGMYLREHLKEGSLLLVKGSQNNVFAEEAIKYLLANPSDSHKLVRQSPAWMKQKRRAFGPPPPPA